jgi:hypothetical protein
VNDTPPPARPRPAFLRGWRRIGALLACVLLLLLVCLPWLAGSFAPGIAASAFAERCAGKLEVGSAQLSWFGRQSLREAVLRDPEGAEVARLDLELPSLWDLARSGGRRLGTLRAELRAALVADEQGLTNLERALAPRAGSALPAEPPAAEPGPGEPAGEEPELELEVSSPLCSWSDARTRAAGRPFEIRGLKARVSLHPGQPARLEASAELSGEEPGRIELDAQVDGLRTQGGFAFGKARARGRIQGFSSAMLDGLAQQRGRLEQVLGPRFDLSFELGDLGPGSGTLACALQSPRTHFVLEGRIEDGLLRCTEQRGLSLELGEPRGFVESCLEPLLPPGTKLVWPDRDAPWKLSCATFALPLPAKAPASAAEFGELLARAELDLALEIPGPIGFENDLTRGVHITPALSGFTARVACAPGKPLTARLDARLIAGETGTLHAELQSAQPWTALDARIEVQDISNAALDALLGREAFLSEGLGRALDLHVVLGAASLAGGTVEATLHSANIDIGLHGRIEPAGFVGEAEHGIELRFAPPKGWLERQLASSLPAQAALEVEAQPIGLRLLNAVLPLSAGTLEATLAGAQANIELDLPGFALQLADGRTLALGRSILRGTLGRGGHATLRLDVPLVQPGPAKCRLQGEIAGLGALGHGELPPLSCDLSLEQLDMASLEPWLPGAARLPALCGGALDLKLRAGELSKQGGTLELLLQAPRLDARFAFAGAQGSWSSTGADQNRLTLALEPPTRALELRLQELVLTPPAGLRARVELALPCSVVDELLDRPAALSGLLGETLALDGAFERAADGTGKLSFALHAPHGEASAAGRLEPGAFVLDEPQGLRVRLEPTDAWFTGLFPPGAGLRRAEGTPKPFTLALHSPRIALPQGEQGWIESLSGTTANLDVQLPDLVWNEAGAAPLALSGIGLRAELKREPGSIVTIRGPLDLELRALDALPLLAEAGGTGRFRVALHGRAQGVPVGVIDALAGQGGLLVEALGARADLTLESAGLSMQSGSFVLDLASPQGPAHLEGELKEGVLRVVKEKGGSAHFSLGPLTSERFVGRLVPLICEVAKPQGAAPASVEVDALAFPLDGDLAKLDGLLRVDLGEVSYALLPGLKGLFGAQAPKPVRLPAFSVPIQKGVVRYDKLLVPIGGREYSFHGSFNLVDGELNFGTSIPLELLGVKVSSELDKARGLIDGKTLVPIEIRGPWNKPRFAVGKGFLDDVVKKALGGALEHGLEDLLKKKKPKKD